MDKNQAETDKRARDLEKCRKYSRERDFQAIILFMRLWTSKILKIVNYGPWIRLWKITALVLRVSDFTKLVPNDSRT